MYFICSMVHSFMWTKRTILIFLLFQHILEIEYEYSIILLHWVREDWCEGTLSKRMCGWIKWALYCCKGPFSTGDLSWYWANVCSIYCSTNSFFFLEKSIFITLWKCFWYFTSSTEINYFHKFLKRKNFVLWFLVLWWGCRFLAKSLWRMSWLCPISDDVASLWLKLSIASWMSIFLSMDNEMDTLFEPDALITCFIRPKSILWHSS